MGTEGPAPGQGHGATQITFLQGQMLYDLAVVQVIVPAIFCLPVLYYNDLQRGKKAHMAMAESKKEAMAMSY